MRDSRLVSTPSVAATPDSRNTGATDDWIRWAMSITWHRCSCWTVGVVEPCGPARAGRVRAFLYHNCLAPGAPRSRPPPQRLLRWPRFMLYDRSTRFSPAWTLPDARRCAPPCRPRCARRRGRAQPARMDLSRPGVLRARARDHLPPQLAARVPSERCAASRRLSYLRISRRAAGGDTHARGRACLPQCLPPSRGATPRCTERLLRTAHHLPVPRLDLC